MSKPKKAKKSGKRKHGLMGRSDIPYSQRLAMKQADNIVANRNHAAKITMFCTSVALNEVEGIGYKRLTKFAIHFKEVLNEFYDDIDVGMAHAKHRMEQMGMPISGEFFFEKLDGSTKREQEVYDHTLHATQIALICSAITMNDEFGYAKKRQERISNRVSELTKRYAKEGERFLFDKLAEIGFDVVDGEVRFYMDDNDNIITPKQYREESGHD